MSSELFECPICDSDCFEPDLISCSGGHRVCLECVASHAKACLLSRQNPLSCPIDDCHSSYSKEDEKYILETLIPLSPEQKADLNDPSANPIELLEKVFNIKFGAPRRDPLRTVSHFDDAVALIHKASKVLVLSGAGISVSSGIPDYRSATGLYTKLAEEGETDPESLLSIQTFLEDPTIVYSLSEAFFRYEYVPTFTHFFVSALEEKGKLLKMYTQNTDHLERDAGLTRVLQCHGSRNSFICLQCGTVSTRSQIMDELMVGVPYCKKCPPKTSVLKPEEILFGESLPDEYYKSYKQDMASTDLVIVAGTSLKVHPFCDLLDIVPAEVPRILINREVVGKPGQFDLCLLGNIDDVFRKLAHSLGWSIPESLSDRISRLSRSPSASESTESQQHTPINYVTPAPVLQSPAESILVEQKTEEISVVYDPLLFDPAAPPFTLPQALMP
ncbi:putative NAD-dependent protein deacetylase sirtuin-1 [Blattamonas nauphoetae]|uniref:NAD-dependent protein deacetylase sirtuin-1 n=1 Tax=Blattamonas nauphoetae TaxID=2049346 RepID=A0ABQ9Y9P7_9EUKA|nr:putative NAD-dependent protein deacetylase sirtuin-1 [Blattamonas nauphoetae]